MAGKSLFCIFALLFKSLNMSNGYPENKGHKGIIFPSPIFGPIHSRRLGLSLGINLMPADGKVCTFDCVYCECGFNQNHRPRQKRPTRTEVAQALEKQLQQMVAAAQLPDVLTFAGNGEPTAHPDFAGIIADTIELRNRYCPNAKVSVLSNATLAMRPEVYAALLQVDNNILKLDTVSADYISRVDRPTGAYSVEQIIETLEKFEGHVIVQSLFMKGTSQGQSVDNTTDQYVLPWIEALKRIRPQSVMVYTIDRETPDPDLLKATREELYHIAELVKQAGFEVEVAY